jgi:hypothetical protein
MSNFGCCCDGHGHHGLDTPEAIVAFHSFCSDHNSHFNVDSSVDIGHPDFGGHGLMSAIGTTLSGPVDHSKEAFGLVLVGHDYIDIRSVVANTLRSLGLMTVLTPQGNRKHIDQYYDVIMPMMAARGGEAAVMPDGYYEGATGITTQWRSFWQLGKQDFGDRFCGRPLQRNPKARWNIDVSITWWYYAETDDYETRLLANVWNGGHMGATAEHRAAHMKAAQAFVKLMAQALSLRTPSARSRRYRANLMAA